MGDVFLLFLYLFFPSVPSRWRCKSKAFVSLSCLDYFLLGWVDVWCFEWDCLDEAAVLSLYSTVCLRPLHLFSPTTLYVEVATGRELVRHERHNPYI